MNDGGRMQVGGLAWVRYSWGKGPGNDGRTGYLDRKENKDDGRGGSRKEKEK